MVLLWKADADSQTGSSRPLFDSKIDADVSKFFFVYENVVIRRKSDEDKAGKLICYLQGDAFEFYYDTYSRNGNLTEAVELSPVVLTEATCWDR